MFIVIDNDRIVADGDIIPGLSPLPDYSHMGNEVLIDGLGDSGTIIVNPTYIEQKFIQKTKASVAAHSLALSYMNGLKNVVEAAKEVVQDTNNATADTNLHTSRIDIELARSRSIYFSTNCQIPTMGSTHVSSSTSWRETSQIREFQM